MSNQKKILIIDDEAAIRNSFAEYLEDHNFDTITAENGRVGLELIQKEQPDMILVDLRMPEVDGLEVLKQTNESNPDIPKIVISGANRIGDVIHTLQYGAWDYLVKPIKDMSILEHTVQKVLEKAQLLKENKEYQQHLESMVQERTRELELAFQKIQSSEKLYRTLFQRTNDAIFIIEKNTLKCLDGNDAATKLVNRSLEELKNMPCGDLLPQNTDEQCQFLQNLDEVKELGHTTIKNADKTTKTAKISMVPLDDTTVIAIARDITHDIQIENQLRHSQKMEAIGTLAGGIAHDFNNILSGILGYTQLAYLRLDNPDKIKKSLDQITQGAQRAAGLIKQILTFSRQTEHKEEPLNLSIIVKEAVKFLKSSIPANIEIQDDIKSKGSIMADPIQVHQVVMNICTNAYHSMSESGGVLSITLNKDEISHFDEKYVISYPPASYLKLEIKDTGHGMDKTTLEKIFDPYFSTKQPDQGTGLGLAVVNGIVKKHNGFIKAYSEVGKGSSFQVFWPLAKKPAVTANLNKKNTRLLHGTEHILFVDDEENILNSNQVILQEYGYRVSIFKDSRKALEAFTNSPDSFDFVVTDMAMPKMTGPELSTHILNIRKDIPIILCTGYSEIFNKKMANKIGIKKYIHKPVTGDEMATYIRELLDKKR